MFESQEDKLLLEDKLSENFAESYVTSIKEVMRKTIMSQEAVFRMQVQELHRIYRRQDTLVKDLKWKESNKCTWLLREPQSTSALPPHYKPQLEENVISAVSMVDLPQTIKPAWPEDIQWPHYGLHRTPFNLWGRSLQDTMGGNNSISLNHGVGVKSTTASGNDKKNEINSSSMDVDVPATCNRERHSHVQVMSDLYNSRMHLDLNRDPPDEINLTRVTPWNKSNSSCKNESSQLLQPRTIVYSTITNSDDILTGARISVESIVLNGEGSKKACFIDLESVPVDPLGEPYEDFCSRGTMPKEGEKSDEDTVSSTTYRSRIVLQDGCNGKSSIAVKPACITDQNSSNVKNSPTGVEKKFQVWDLNLSPMDDSGNTQCAETYSSEHCMSVGSSKCAIPKERITDEHCREPIQLDDLVQGAAQSLVHLYFVTSARSNDRDDNVEAEELVEEDKQPQYSCDSFEKIVLNLQESSADDNYAASEVIELEENKKGLGVKMRRGRRLKNFQKDILPGLVSLSRQEIREDMHNFGEISIGNLLRKNKLKKITEDNWCVPARNKRRRSSRIRRRIG